MLYDNDNINSTKECKLEISINEATNKMILAFSLSAFIIQPKPKLDPDWYIGFDEFDRIVKIKPKIWQLK